MEPHKLKVRELRKKNEINYAGSIAYFMGLRFFIGKSDSNVNTLTHTYIHASVYRVAMCMYACVCTLYTHTLAK